LESIPFFSIEFTDGHDEGQQEKIEVAFFVIHVVVEKTLGEKDAPAKNAEE
jgi:hypothetical protein